MPSLTFFNENYEIDKELHTLLIRHILLNGADSIYLFNPRGAGYYFSDKIEEKIQLIDLSLEVTGGKVPLLVGIFGNDKINIVEQLEIIGKKFENISLITSLPYSEKISDIKSYFDSIFSTININNDILLYNNPELFGNEIEPQVVNQLINEYKIVGLVDSYNNINYCKSFIKLIGSDFSFFCENEPNFQKFFQLIPGYLREYVGIVSSISNLVNLCSKLYFCAIEEKLLELHQLQEQIIEIGGKLYDIKVQSDRARRGIKYAFLHLYRNFFSKPIENYIYLYPDMPVDIDEITKKRIEAIVNYLLNQNQIYRLYSLGKDEYYQLDEIIKKFSKVDILLNQGKINKIIGPLDAENNTVYKVNFENNQLIFKFRTSKYFQYENIVKEKVLFPLIDHSLDLMSKDAREKFKNIISISKGSYIFTPEHPPIIPVGHLLYYDETKEIVPYLFSVQQYFDGISLFDLYNQYNGDSFNFSRSKFMNLFHRLGMSLGRLHQIPLDSFYNDILDLGKNVKNDWTSIFKSQLATEMQKFKKIYPELELPILNYFKNNEVLIEEETEPVLLHNDFQWSNIIVLDSQDEITIKGIIDFDNWGIGVRAQDLVKVNLLTLDKIDNNDITSSFFEGYKKLFAFNAKTINAKIDLYTLFSAIQMINFDKTKPQIYYSEVERILDK